MTGPRPCTCATPYGHRPIPCERHTEPESLDAWADRVLHTITDEEWRFHFEAARSRIPPDGDASRALLSRLDRIAGEHPGLALALELPAAWDAALRDGLVSREGMPSLRMDYTPLGRAVLARKAAQR